MKINFLPNITRPDDFTVIDIKDYFDYVRGAKFEEQIMAFRNSRNEPKDVQTKIKNKIPAVTISGTFRDVVKNANLSDHSGFICIDFDHVENIGAFKTSLQSDKYTYAVLYSASGNGLAAVVKIDGSKHSDAYDGLKNYYFKHYSQLIDKSCRNVSRLRFLSMDKDLFINPKSSIFKDYPKKERAPKSFSTVLTGTEFDELISKVVSGGIDLTGGDYATYLTIGFALASEFAEGGRSFFHTICQANSKYDPANCDKQYTYCMRDGGQKKVRIGSFYHLCKAAGIELKSRASYQLEGIAKMAKKQSRTKESVVEIAKAAGLDPRAAEEMAVAVFDKNVNLEIAGETQLGLCRTFVQSNYRLRYNVITNNIEDRNTIINGQYKVISDMELNTMYMLFTESTEEKITRDFFNTFIFSEFTEYYNPFKEFVKINADIERTDDLITQLAASIETDTENADKYIRHWACGVIASIYGTTSPLVLVLAGEKQNTGKTEWFRRLLPATLKQYYAESKLDAGKDDDILMCKKLLIMDDEFGGGSRREARHLKQLTSRDTFSIRMPYGRVSKDMQRIASLCGTTNDLNLISDPTGNRRIVPINVLSVDHAKYNAIDKAALFMAFYDLYQSGFKWQFNSEDIKMLNAGSDEFIDTNFEGELIETYFEIPSEHDLLGEFMTNTQIKDWIETLSNQKVFNTKKLGLELKNLGYKQKRVKKNKLISRMYHVKKRNNAAEGTPEFQRCLLNPTRPEHKEEELF